MHVPCAVIVRLHPGRSTLEDAGTVGAKDGGSLRRLQDEIDLAMPAYRASLARMPKRNPDNAKSGSGHQIAASSEGQSALSCTVWTIKYSHPGLQAPRRTSVRALAAASISVPRLGWCPSSGWNRNHGCNRRCCSHRTRKDQLRIGRCGILRGVTPAGTVQIQPIAEQNSCAADHRRRAAATARPLGYLWIGVSSLIVSGTEEIGFEAPFYLARHRRRALLCVHVVATTAIAQAAAAGTGMSMLVSPLAAITTMPFANAASAAAHRPLRVPLWNCISATTTAGRAFTASLKRLMGGIRIQ